MQLVQLYQRLQSKIPEKIRARLKQQRGILIVALLLVSALHVVDWLYPLRVIQTQISYSQLVTAKDGQVLRAFADDNGVWRQKISLDEVSPLYIDALLNYEDRWFWYHPGMNPVSLIRAAWLNARCGCVVSGGSTLSMQVARILHPHPRSFSGKLSQILRSFQLEWHFSKKEILELYLNLAPFGGTVEGIAAASYAYLGKAPIHMTRAEAALMAVLPQRPSRIRPDRYPQRAQKARNKVLRRMSKLGVWTNKVIQDAKQEQVLAEKPRRPRIAPLLSRKLVKQYPQQRVIKTEIDYFLQQGIENQVSNWIRSQPEKSSAAILVVENSSMAVRAYIGSADFNDKRRFGHVDMIQALRSPGSTLKPFIYGLALDQGLIHSRSLLSDTPRFYSDYKPENFSRGFTGPVSVEKALHRSLNVPAVQVMEHLGPARFYSRMRAANINLTLPKDARPSLAIALGGVGINLWNLVQAYSSLANQGQVHKLKIRQQSQSSKGHYLMSPEAAWVVYKMLSSHRRPGAVFSQSIRINENPIAWKTGTSYGFRDAWAIGSSSQYTIGVWLGRPDGTPQTGHYGGLNAAPLLFSVADEIHKNKISEITQPQSVQAKKICWPLGQLASQTEKTMCHKTQTAWIIRGMVPRTLNNQHEKQWIQNPLTIWLNRDNGRLVDLECNIKRMQKKKIALWPKELDMWIAKKYRYKTQIPKTDPACKKVPMIQTGGIKIIGVKNNTILRLPGNQQTKLPMVNLNALGGFGERQWYVNGRYIEKTQSRQQINYQFKKTGKHQLMVVDKLGNSDRVNVQVRQ